MCFELFVATCFVQWILSWSTRYFVWWELRNKALFLFYVFSNFFLFWIWLFLQVDDMTADLVISQLLLLDAQDSERDITLFINSPGGSITAGLCSPILNTVLDYKSFWNWFGLFYLIFRDGNIWCNETMQGRRFDCLLRNSCIHGCVSPCFWFQRETLLHA